MILFIATQKYVIRDVIRNDVALLHFDVQFVAWFALGLQLTKYFNYWLINRLFSQLVVVWIKMYKNCEKLSQSPR